MKLPKRLPRTSHDPAANTLWVQHNGNWIKIPHARVERDGTDFVVIALPDPGSTADSREGDR